MGLLVLGVFSLPRSGFAVDLLLWRFDLVLFANAWYLSILVFRGWWF